MIDIILKDMKYRKTRSVLTVCGIAVIIMLLAWLSASTHYVAEDVERSIAEYMGTMYVVSKTPSGYPGQEFPPTWSSLDYDTAMQLLDENGVDKTHSTPLLFVEVAPPAYPGAPPGILAVGLLPGKERVYIGDLKAREGVSQFTDSDSAVTILGRSVADFYQVRVGDSISIMGESQRVIGILEDADTALLDNLLLLPLEYSQSLFHRRGSVSTVLLTPTNIGDIDQTSQSIQNETPTLEVYTYSKIAENVGQSLETMRTFFGMIDFIIACAAIILILVVMIITVHERTREMGTLRALGESSSRILLMILEESVFLGILGTACGLGLSLLLMKGSYGFVFFYPSVFIRVMVLGIVVSALGGLYPALYASHINPVEALRYE